MGVCVVTIFKDVDGKEHNLDYLLRTSTVTLEPNKDIVTGDINGGTVMVDNEPYVNVNKNYYEALDKLLIFIKNL